MERGRGWIGGAVVEGEAPRLISVTSHAFLVTPNDHDNERISFPSIVSAPDSRASVASCLQRPPSSLQSHWTAVREHLKVRPVTGTRWLTLEKALKVKGKGQRKKCCPVLQAGNSLAFTLAVKMKWKLTIMRQVIWTTLILFRFSNSQVCRFDS